MNTPLPNLLPRCAAVIAAAFVLTLPGQLAAVVQPAVIFQDRAVLQRDVPLPVWGQAAPGEKVTVNFAGQTRSTTAEADGRWRVTLDPIPVHAEGATLVITGENTILLKDILVGEVWLVSGQSNMEWNVSNTHDADLERLTARLPLVRELKVKKTTAKAPASSVEAVWTAASPATVGQFSAVAYYFSREVHLALEGVPIGILNASWGGTPIEAWMSAGMLASDPAFAVVHERWTKAMEAYPQALAQHEAAMAEWNAEKAAAEAAGQSFWKAAPRAPQGPDSPHRPTSLYNGMIAPLLPAAFRGALWYQGESNANHERAPEYHRLFSTLITDWRRDFGHGEFPFFWVQLAAFRAGNESGLNWPMLREAQTRTLALPATGQAVVLDAPTSDINDIHPRDKLTVGRRLARLALARVYGFKNLADSGPQFAGFAALAAPADGSAPAALRVSFTPEKRRVRHAAHQLTGFEVAGEDRVFHPADARIEGRHVLVSSPLVTAPVAVRYAWRNAPDAWLEDDIGLPVPPFRSDDW